MYIYVKNGSTYVHKAAAPYGTSIQKKDGKIREMDCGKNAPAWNSLKTVIV